MVVMLVCVTCFSAMVVMFVVYGVAALPFVYLLSFFFKGSTAGYVVIAIFLIVTGRCPLHPPPPTTRRGACGYQLCTP